MASCRLSKEFECPICLEEMDDPRLMGQCFHSACLVCIKGLTNASINKTRFVCPMCNVQCTIPEGGVSKLRADFKLASIMQQYKLNIADQTLGKIIALCGVCGDSAVKYCQECTSIYMCAGCAEKHDKNSFTQGHILSTLGTLCKYHGKPLFVFCLDCGKSICSICMQSNHTEHNVQSISKMNSEILGWLPAATIKLETLLSEIQVEEERIKVTKHFTTSYRDVDLYKLKEIFVFPISDTCLELQQIRERKYAFQKDIRVLVKSKRSKLKKVRRGQMCYVKGARVKQYYNDEREDVKWNLSQLAKEEDMKERHLEKLRCRKADKIERIQQIYLKRTEDINEYMDALLRFEETVTSMLKSGRQVLENMTIESLGSKANFDEVVERVMQQFYRKKSQFEACFSDRSLLASVNQCIPGRDKRDKHDKRHTYFIVLFIFFMCIVLLIMFDQHM